MNSHARLATECTTMRINAKGAGPISKLSRRQRVWGALGATLTGIGGLFLLLDRAPVAGPGGGPALMATSGVDRGVSQILDLAGTIEPGRWKGIVIHHSGSAVGSAESVTRQHQDMGLRGLGYHFVVTNGKGGPDGQIAVGYRWTDQLPGAHTSGVDADRFNREYLGICLVGDGDRRPFTDAQLGALAELVGELTEACGIPGENVVLSRDVSPSAGPGRLFPEAAFRARLDVVMSRS